MLLKAAAPELLAALSVHLAAASPNPSVAGLGGTRTRVLPIESVAVHCDSLILRIMIGHATSSTHTCGVLDLMSPAAQVPVSSS